MSSGNSDRSHTRSSSAHSSTGRGLIVGVTGGIGSGKSSVCRLFKARGRRVFSADEIATQLTRSDHQTLAALRRTFGPTVFTSRGKIDRARLASIVFRNRRMLRRLNAIVHPRVLKVLRRKIRQLPPSNRHPFIVVESALIFEAGLEEMFDLVLLIHAPLALRVSRVRAQSGMSKNEVLARVARQIPPAKAREKAHFSLRNSGSLRELNRAVGLLDRLFSQMVSFPPEKP